MQSVNINKKYKVTLELDVSLDQVRDHCESINLEEITEESMADGLIIDTAAHHLGNDLVQKHIEEDTPIDYIDFTVTNYNVIKVEEE